MAIDNDSTNDSLRKLDDQSKAKSNFDRYTYGKLRGHTEWSRTVRYYEQMYIGEGAQWDAELRRELEEAGKPVYEFNEIKTAIDHAIALQIKTRVDLIAQPASGKATDEIASSITKLIKHISDDNNLQKIESEVFTDGAIGGRGFYELKMDFSKDIMGRLDITTPDPLDVIPDPDAKSMDPDTWSDVIITSWPTLDDIEARYGRDKRIELEQNHNFAADRDFGDDDLSVPRNRFGSSQNYFYYDQTFVDDKTHRHVRVIDRQYWVTELATVAIFANNDIRVIDGLKPEIVAQMIQDGAMISKRQMKRIRWLVTTLGTVLHDSYSPYEHFTIVPFFYNFRRGLTHGAVGNMIDRQIVTNKMISQMSHIASSVANSGFYVEEGSLVNFDEDSLRSEGGKPGTIMVYKAGSQPPEKIKPNEIPEAINRVFENAHTSLKNAVIPEAARGMNDTNDVSGVAILAKQAAARDQLAVPLDNLAYTRKLLGKRILSIIQRFYTHEMEIRITETDPISGVQKHRMLELNKKTDDVGFLNDLTIGNYDITLMEVPLSDTFGATQFDQVMKMRQLGINIPDAVAIRYSMLQDKEDITEQIEKSQQNQPDPLTDAKVDLIKAQARLAAANATQAGMTTLFESLNTAEIIVNNPATSQVADHLTKSVGFVDQGPPPVIPTIENSSPLAGAAAMSNQAIAAPGQTPDSSQIVKSMNQQAGVDVHLNTHPNFPPHLDPARNAMKGIETAAETDE